MGVCTRLEVWYSVLHKCLVCKRPKSNDYWYGRIGIGQTSGQAGKPSQLAAFIQQRIRNVYRRQRPAALPSRTAKSRHQSQLGVDGSRAGASTPRAVDGSAGDGDRRPLTAAAYALSAGGAPNVRGVSLLPCGASISASQTGPWRPSVSRHAESIHACARHGIAASNNADPKPVLGKTSPQPRWHHRRTLLAVQWSDRLSVEISPSTILLAGSCRADRRQPQADAAPG